MTDAPLKTRSRTGAVWALVLTVLIAPVAIAAASPLQAWRDAAYVTGAMAGVIGLSVLTLQPLLAAGYLPGLRRPAARRLHRWLGAGLVCCIALHIGGLYLSSPMDVMDALLLVSPTPFSVYGVTATIAAALTALLVAFRGRFRVRPTTWRVLHNLLALVVVVATVVHALMIDGAMGYWSKWTIAALAVAAAAGAIIHLRLFKAAR